MVCSHRPYSPSSSAGDLTTLEQIQEIAALPSPLEARPVERYVEGEEATVQNGEDDSDDEHGDGEVDEESIEKGCKGCVLYDKCCLIDGHTEMAWERDEDEKTKLVIRYIVYPD